MYMVRCRHWAERERSYCQNHSVEGFTWGRRAESFGKTTKMPMNLIPVCDWISLLELSASMIEAVQTATPIYQTEEVYENRGSLSLGDTTGPVEARDCGQCGRNRLLLENLCHPCWMNQAVALRKSRRIVAMTRIRESASRLRESASRLRESRIRVDLTQSDLASRLGVSTGTISRWESERTPIPPTRHKQIDKIFTDLTISTEATMRARRAKLRGMISKWRDAKRSR